MASSGSPGGVGLLGRFGSLGFRDWARGLAFSSLTQATSPQPQPPTIRTTHQGSHDIEPGLPHTTAWQTPNNWAFTSDFIAIITLH